MDIIYEIGIAGYELPDGKVIKFELDYKDTLCSSFEQIYSTDSSKLFIPNSKTPKFNISAVSAGSGKPLTTAELINPEDSTVNNEVAGPSNRKVRFPEKCCVIKELVYARVRIYEESGS